MLKMRRILRDYQDAGSVNSLLALWGFVDDDTFLTKAGDVGVVCRTRRSGVAACAAEGVGKDGAILEG